MKRLFALLLLLPLVACGDDEVSSCLDRIAAPSDGDFFDVEWKDDESIHIVLDDGFRVSFDEPPKRVVTTLPGLTEIVDYLGARERLVGVSPHCDLEGLDVRRVSVMPLDIEAILALEPDLVLVDRTLFRSQLPELQERIPGLLPLETSQSLDALSRSITLIAGLVGGLDGAVAFEARRVALEDQLGSAAPETPPRVLVVSLWDPLNVLGPGSLIDDCLRVCGCVNVACDLKGASNTFDEELVIARQPDWILHRSDAVPGWVATRWASVPAVANGRVGPCEVNDLSRGGPFILNALERLAAVLHGRAAIDTLVPGDDK